MLELELVKAKEKCVLDVKNIDMALQEIQVNISNTADLLKNEEKITIQLAAENRELENILKQAVCAWGPYTSSDLTGPHQTWDSSVAPTSLTASSMGMGPLDLIRSHPTSLDPRHSRGATLPDSEQYGHGALRPHQTSDSRVEPPSLRASSRGMGRLELIRPHHFWDSRVAPPFSQQAGRSWGPWTSQDPGLSRGATLTESKHEQYGHGALRPHQTSDSSVEPPSLRASSRGMGPLHLGRIHQSSYSRWAPPSQRASGSSSPSNANRGDDGSGNENSRRRISLPWLGVAKEIFAAAKEKIPYAPELLKKILTSS
eukprot:gene23379-30640_t